MLSIHDLVHTYGYWAVFCIVAAEGVAIPTPGETIVVAAAIYAGKTHHLDIGLVIAAAIGGALCGNALGFWIGREYGYDLLLRYGRYIRLDEAKLKLGQYLFWRHGGKIVVIGRFVFFLRIFGAVLAGANRMSWVRFMTYTAVGTAAWAALFGLGGYFFGKQVWNTGHVGTILTVGIVVVVILGYAFLHFNWRRLQAEAERQFPGPLQPLHMHHPGPVARPGE